MLCNLAEKIIPTESTGKHFAPFLLPPRLDRYYSDLILRSAIGISSRHLLVDIAELEPNGVSWNDSSTSIFSIH